MDIKYLTERNFEVTRYKKGSVIYRPQQQPRYVYFVKTGEVRMVTVNDDGKEFVQGTFKSKQYFGEPALLLKRPYLAYTIASKDSELILVDEQDFLKLLDENRAFSMDLIYTLSNRLFYKSMMLEELGNEHAEHRLRTLIKYLCADLDTGQVLDVTRQALADRCGLRVETVIRIIKKLEDNAEIKLIKGKIVK